MSVSNHHVSPETSRSMEAPPRSPQHNSRSRILANLGSLQLDAEPDGISENKRENEAPGSRPVCFSPDRATNTILQL